MISRPYTDMRRSARLPLALLLLIALVVRMVLPVALPGVAHPDEIFQYNEPAFRLVHGRGLVPWEYVLGIRSWFLPGLLIPVFALLKAVAANVVVTSLVLATLSSILSLAMIPSAFVLAARAAGPAAGWCAALLVAFWPESVYFSAHILADTISPIPLLAAMAVAGRPPADRRRLLAAGALFALTVMIRPQLVPAVAVAALSTVRWHWRDWTTLALAALPVVAVFGLIDQLALGTMFVSYVRYTALNGGGVAATFGVQPASYYVKGAWEYWGWGTIIIAITALVGAYRARAMAAVAVTIVITFSLVGHKEHRFVYPALPFVMIVCGIGTSVIWQGLASRWSRTVAIAGCAGAWLGVAGCSVATAATTKEIANGVSMTAAMRLVSKDPGICGVAVDSPEFWILTGYSRLRSGLILYHRGDDLEGEPLPYTAIIMHHNAPEVAIPSRRWRQVACYRGGAPTCVFVSPHACAPPRADLMLVAEPPPETRRALVGMGYGPQLRRR